MIDSVEGFRKINHTGLYDRTRGVCIENSQWCIRWTRACVVEHFFTFPYWLRSMWGDICLDIQTLRRFYSVAIGVSEIGLRSRFVSWERLIFGKGITSADFHREGNVAWEIEALKIDEIGALSDSALVLSNQFGISSGPMAFWTFILERATETWAGEMMYSSGTESTWRGEKSSSEMSLTMLQNESAICSTRSFSFKVWPLWRMLVNGCDLERSASSLILCHYFLGLVSCVCLTIEL